MNLKKCKKELEEVRSILKQVNASLRKAPEGSLMVKRVGCHVEFYHRLPGKASEKRVYLSKKDLPLIRRLAQKEYDLKVRKKLVCQEKALNTFCRWYDEFGFSQVYHSMLLPKRELINPYFEPDDVFLQKWKEHFHSGIVNTYPIENGYRTKQGEIVRSKSEMIFADKLYDLHIPYLYESHLRMKDGHSLFPDFTVLNVRTRETWFVELFGKMDDPEYANRTMEKIKIYSSNGMIVGKSLLFLMESSHVGIDISQINQLIHNYLL